MAKMMTRAYKVSRTHLDCPGGERCCAPASELHSKRRNRNKPGAAAATRRIQRARERREWING